MSAPARFRQADLKRALKAAKDCGYDDVRVRIGIGGEIEVIVGKAANDQADPVELD
jgi:hypothetical protein